jgi:hypothetical protein
MNFKKKILLLWGIFALLDPDLDPLTRLNPDLEPQHWYYDYLEGVSLRLEELPGLGQVLELVRSLRLPLLQEVLESLLTPATRIYLQIRKQIFRVSDPDPYPD